MSRQGKVTQRALREALPPVREVHAGHLKGVPSPSRTDLSPGEEMMLVLCRLISSLVRPCPHHQLTDDACRHNHDMIVLAAFLKANTATEKNVIVGPTAGGTILVPR